MALTLGITFHNSDDLNQLLGGNGLNQNVILFYDLLTTMGHRVFMITQEKKSPFMEIEGRNYEIKTAQELIDQSVKFDIAFEAGLTLAQDERMSFRQRCGARIVSVRYGNSLFLDMEGLFVKQEMSSNCHVGKAEVTWISPHFEKSAYYMEALYQSPVELAPFIWEPWFTRKRFTPDDFGGKQKLVVMEPNTSVLKNALIPLVMINEVCRQDPDLFDIALILNGTHYCNEPHFLTNFAMNLPYVSSDHNKVTFSGRYRIYDVFDKPHVMVGCQHYNGLNYLYLEALYMGIPLVHNSPDFIDVGYFYPEFDVRTGKKQIIRALTEYDPAQARAQNDLFLHRFSIVNPQVQARYRQLIDQAMSIPLVTSI